MDSVDPQAILGTTLVDPTGRHAVILASLIGSGSFAHVYLAEEIPAGHKRPEKRAVKRLFKEGLDKRQLLLQRQEAEVMKAIDPHQNIIRLLATVEDEECLYLIMEYCDLDLYEAITQQGGFPDDVVKEVFGQIADAVIHCHASGFYHRDLKPENCLISSDYKVKLADFGLATSDPWSTEMGCGSVRYMAPECFDPLHNVPEGSTLPIPEVIGYSPPANDVWALGVILINLLFGKNPWFEAHKTDAIFNAYCSSNPNILRQQFNLSPQFDAVLRRAFELDPVRRCSIADLKHMVEATTVFVGTPAHTPSPPPPVFSYTKESILTSPGLVLPPGIPVRLPVDMKRVGGAMRHSAISTPPPETDSRETTTSTVIENGYSVSATEPQEPEIEVPANSSAEVPLLGVEDMTVDSRVSAVDELREKMTIDMAAKMLESDDESLKHSTVPLLDGEGEESDATEQSNEASKRTSALRKYRLSFASSNPEIEAVASSAKPDVVDNSTETPMDVDASQTEAEEPKVDEPSVVSPPATEAATVTVPPLTSIVSSAAEMPSCSRDSGFESASGVPSRDASSVERATQNPRSTSRSGNQQPSLSRPSRISKELSRGSAEPDGDAGSSDSGVVVTVPSAPELSENTGTVRPASIVGSSVAPHSEPLPGTVLADITKTAVDPNRDDVSFELPSATRRIFRTSKIFKFGRARTPIPEDEESPAPTPSQLPSAPRTARNPSPKGWFTVQMVRESPGRPSAASATPGDRPMGVIGMLGLRRGKASTPNSSIDLTPESSAAAIEKSAFRRPSWRASSPFGGRRTPVFGKGQESSSRTSGSETSSIHEGRDGQPSPSVGSTSSREGPVRKLRSALSVSSMKKAWQTIREKTGKRPASPTTPTDGYPRNLPPRPASANDIHHNLPATTGRKWGRPRAGGKELISGDLFAPAQSSPLGAVTSGASPVGSPASVAGTVAGDAAPATPLFAEVTGTSPAAPSAAVVSAVQAAVAGASAHDFSPLLSPGAAVAAGGDRRRKHRSSSAPPA
ncbi:hypothetical protein HK405_003431, partial [Cladochytrium tenue]